MTKETDPFLPGLHQGHLNIWQNTGEHQAWKPGPSPHIEQMHRMAICLRKERHQGQGVKKMILDHLVFSGIAGNKIDPPVPFQELGLIPPEPLAGGGIEGQPQQGRSLFKRERLICRQGEQPPSCRARSALPEPPAAGYDRHLREALPCCTR